jgi:Zn-dependent metalloprotease
LKKGTNYYSATDFFNATTYWNNVNPQLDQYATDAHFATMSTYDYLLNVHDRNSIDGKGYSLLSYVHYSNNYVNAFWDGQRMTYGDGNPSQGATPLTTIDICGHEVTHGLTEFTANLTYAYESGALSEAYSDIFGTAIEFYAVPEYAN